MLFFMFISVGAAMFFQHVETAAEQEMCDGVIKLFEGGGKHLINISYKT